MSDNYASAGSNTLQTLLFLRQRQSTFDHLFVSGLKSINQIKHMLWLIDFWIVSCQGSKCQHVISTRINKSAWILFLDKRWNCSTSKTRKCTTNVPMLFFSSDATEQYAHLFAIHFDNRVVRGGSSDLFSIGSSKQIFQCLLAFPNDSCGFRGFFNIVI